MDTPSPQTSHEATAQKLAQGYHRSTRYVETISIFLFLVTEAFLLLHVIPDLTRSPLVVIPALFLGYLAADLVSGFVHWLGDTWGTPETPVFGANFIRPFREHHLDQTAITRHDFIETNGSNCLGSLLVLLPTILILLALPRNTWIVFLLSFITSLTLSVFGTNQFHKWAHMAHPPTLIAWLQRKHLILSPEHHALHHRYPHDGDYCITVGWLNPLLEKIYFFRSLERLITVLTGAVARQNDQELIKTIKPS